MRVARAKALHPDTINPRRGHLVDPIRIGRALAVKGDIPARRTRRKRRWR